MSIHAWCTLQGCDFALVRHENPSPEQLLVALHEAAAVMQAVLCVAQQSSVAGPGFLPLTVQALQARVLLDGGMSTEQQVEGFTDNRLWRLLASALPRSTENVSCS